MSPELEQSIIKHLDKVKRTKYPDMVKKFGVTVDELKEVMIANGRKVKKLPKAREDAIKADIIENVLTDEEIWIKCGKVVCENTIRCWRIDMGIPPVPRQGKSVNEQEVLDRGYPCVGVADYWEENEEIQRLLDAWPRSNDLLNSWRAHG